LQPDDADSYLHVPHVELGERIARIAEQGNTHGLGHQLMQARQPLGDPLRAERIDAGRVTAWPREASDKTKLTGSSPTPKTIGIVVVVASDI
jgi:hypothetical protein